MGLCEGDQERTSAAVGRGAELPVRFFFFNLRNISEGGTSAVSGSAGAPVRVAGLCQCGNRPVFLAALGLSWEPRCGDLRTECDLGWFQADASAAAVTGDAIFSAVWLGILLRCWRRGGWGRMSGVGVAVGTRLRGGRRIQS